MIRGWIYALVVALAATSTAQGQAPYVGASEADNEFWRITPEHMKVLQSKKILVGSRSFCQNLLSGLNRQATKGPEYKLNAVRNFVNLVEKPLESFPTDAFTKYQLVHYLCSLSPLSKRVDEFDTLLRQPPHSFGKSLDVAMIDFSSVKPDVFDHYSQKMDALRKDFPSIKFIYVTGGLHPESRGKPEDDSWEFSEKVLRAYRGRVPVMDWRSLLSTHADGTSAGQFMCAEFNTRPAAKPDQTHPNAPVAEERLGRAFLVMLYKLYCNPGLTANAGFDRQVLDADSDGQESVMLDGSASVASVAPEGEKGRPRIVRYVWREGDRVLADTAESTAKVNLNRGTHAITLTVTNDASPPQTSVDEVHITVTKAGEKPAGASAVAPSLHARAVCLTASDRAGWAHAQ